MSVIRCPQCNLPLTRDECPTGACPLCGAAVAVPASAPAAPEKPPAPSTSFGAIVLFFAAACLIFFAGSGAGFLAHAHPIFAAAENDDGTPTDQTPNTGEHTEPTSARPIAGALPTAKEKSTSAPADAAKILARVKELETLASKLTQDLDMQKKLTAEADERADTARADMDQERKLAEARLKEATDKLGQELAKARDRETTAVRDADELRKGRNQGGQERVKELELLTRKLNDDLEAQKRLTRDAKGREEAVKVNLAQARREGLQTIEQVRREGKQALDQVRREGQQALEQVRQQLRQQEGATQRARAEAEKQRRAAEEAKRNSK